MASLQAEREAERTAIRARNRSIAGRGQKAAQKRVAGEQSESNRRRFRAQGVALAQGEFNSGAQKRPNRSRTCGGAFSDGFYLIKIQPADRHRRRFYAHASRNLTDKPPTFHTETKEAVGFNACSFSLAEERCFSVTP